MNIAYMLKRVKVNNNNNKKKKKRHKSENRVRVWELLWLTHWKGAKLFSSRD